MKQAFSILIISILMTSCATLFNRPYKNVTIHTTEPSKLIVEQDTIQTVDNKAHLRVKRQEKLLPIVAVTDSLTKSILVEPRNSGAYWLNLYYYGIGMLVDMNNSKRWTYPGKIFINSSDATSDYSYFGQANNKGELYLHFSVPTINPFRMVVENEGEKSMIGVAGITIGLDYYHSKDQFVHFGFSGLFAGWSTQRNPATEQNSRNTERESMTTEYFSLSNNHKMGRFSIGYGLSFSKNVWVYKKTDAALFLIPFLLTIDYRKQSHHTLGLVFPAYFQLGEYVNMGIVYRPSFFRLNTVDKFAYEHLISIDFAWKVRLKR
ncbi:MAG: hypothetical protein LBU91_08970 [Bacteroidales bacterium]|jgi:hypothetical protein|nr:hypothetical protein [Bacteroidales bacterium]